MVSAFKWSILSALVWGYAALAAAPDPRDVQSLLSAASYAEAKSRLGDRFEQAFRALAENPENLDSLARLVLVGGADAAAIEKFLPIVEGKLFSIDIPIEPRRQAAERLFRMLETQPRLLLKPQVLELYDLSHAARLLRPHDAHRFLSEVHEAGGKTLDEWVHHRQDVLDGLVKEFWRAPYKSIPGLPDTTHQMHTVKDFAPIKDEFEGIRRLQELSYPIHYTENRQKFQSELMRKMLKKGKSGPYPRLVFTSGPLGSGKTTSVEQLITDHYLPAGDFLVIDPDKIREMIPEYRGFLKGRYGDYAAHLVQHETMDMADILLEKAMKEGKNIVFSTSMRDHGHYSALIERIRKTSPQYTLEMVQVKRSAENILAVNKNPKTRRGRKTPLELAVASIAEVDETAKKIEPLFDRVTVIDNNGAKPVIMAIRNVKRRSAERVAYVFSDIDWTLASPLSGPASAYPNEGWKLVSAQGQMYRVADHVDEFVQMFLDNPDLRLGIASGGTMARNVEFLKNVYPPSLKGRSLYDFVDVLISNEDLQARKTRSKKFEYLFRKSIDSPLGVGADYALLDDQKGFIESLKGHGIWAGKTYDYYPTWEDAEKARGNPAIDQRYLPKTRKDWLAERNRFYRFREIIEESAKKWRKGDRLFGEIVAEEAKKFRSRDLRCLMQALGAFKAIGR